MSWLHDPKNPVRRSIKIHSVVPHLASAAGGALLNVTGSNFRDFGDVRCRFGNASFMTFGSVKALDLIQCNTPVYPIPAQGLGRRYAVQLEVTLNGVDFTRSGDTSSFTFFDASYVQISHLAPSGGPARGDTRVTVHGMGFEGHGERGVRGKLPPTSKSYLPPSKYASCIWWRPNASCVEGIDCRADCARPGACAMKVQASYADRRTIVCASPPAVLVRNTSGDNTSTASSPPPTPLPHDTYHLDLTFDDHSYTSLNESTFIYYSPSSFGVSFVDPLGGPTAGGTTILILGGGFLQLGASRYNLMRAAKYDAASSDANNGTSSHDWRLLDGTHCLFGADPFHGNTTTRTPATLLSPTRMLCKAPPFEGDLSYHKMPSPVHILLNGDDAARSELCAGCNYTYYDPRAARISTIDTFGGPPMGGTWVRLTGRLFSDLRRYGGELSNADELLPTDERTLGPLMDRRPRVLRQLETLNGGASRLWTPFDGNTTTGGGWVLQCRFGSAGHTDAILAYEISYEMDNQTSLVKPTNYTMTPWEAIPIGKQTGRPEPVVWCRSPPLVRVEQEGFYGNSFYRGGRRQAVTLDLTLNGQDYISNGARQFLYFPRDIIIVNCSETEGVCHESERQGAYLNTYRGTLNTTVTGRTCQRWDEQSPHKHAYTEVHYPDAGLHENYCRQPGGLRNSAPWCYTTDPGLRWDTCDIGNAPDGDTLAVGGVRVQRLHPFGGPAVGGTPVTVIGRQFAKLVDRVGSILCNFGNTSADAAPLGGPARDVAEGRSAGALPWHVPGTLLNDTHIKCISPPLHNMTNGTYEKTAVEVTLNGQLEDMTHSSIQYEYYGPEVLRVKWIYPKAGPKQGGTKVTIYGTGFKSLGLVLPTINVVDDTTTYSSRGLRCIFGDLPMSEAIVTMPIGSDEARPALGDDPLIEGDDEPLASVIECDSPPWSNVSTYYLPPGEAEANRCTADDERALCMVDTPKTVCLRVTLNDNPHQHSGDCIKFTYYDV